MNYNPYRKDFPLLENNKVIYLDNAATSQRPEAVIQAEAQFYEKYNANPLRGLYELSVEATDCYEEARETVRKFIGAESTEEIIFTRNTTEGLNLVAYSYGLNHLKAGDEVLVSIMEHHSNLLPWQMVCRQTGAELKFLECDQTGFLSDETLENAITDKTRLVAIAQVSNVLGRTAPVEKIVKLAREHGAVVVMDAAQSAPHMPINVKESGCRFYGIFRSQTHGTYGDRCFFYGKERTVRRNAAFPYRRRDDRFCQSYRCCICTSSS